MKTLREFSLTAPCLEQHEEGEVLHEGCEGGVDAVLVEVGVPDHGDGGAAGVGTQVLAALIRARHAWTLDRSLN